MVKSGTVTEASRVSRITAIQQRVKPPTWNDIKFLFIGAGNMGARLALNYAQQGFPLGMLDISEERIKFGLGLIEVGKTQAIKRRIYTPAQADEISQRILTTTNYEEASQGRNLQIVVESAIEDIKIKEKIFKRLDELCAPPIIFTSNSSSFSIERIANFTNRPDKVAWTHYFHEAHINRAAEYAGGTQTSAETLERVREFLWLGGKTPFLVKSPRKGGAADPIFVALLKEAALMLEEGHNMVTIEEAAKKALGMPMGFFELMDVTGIPVGFYSMKSFSDSSNSHDPFYQIYGNFYTPTPRLEEITQRYNQASEIERAKVQWLTAEEKQKSAADKETIDYLAERFLAVTFLVSSEIVGSGLIEQNELRELIKTAFLWKKDPFEIMNQMGMANAFNLAQARSTLAQNQGLTLSLPPLLRTQREKNEPWKLEDELVTYTRKGNVAEIVLMRPRAANAMDDFVFSAFSRAFRRAAREGVIMRFDTAPIKTFIAGADIDNFLRLMRAGLYEKIRDDTKKWQDILFSQMTGTNIPKVAIVDGQALGGGGEVWEAFAYDQKSVVIATQRTTLAFPETRLGIYPGLRGTILPLHIIRAATGDEDLALAVTRAMILAGSPITSPRLLKYLGFADFVVPSHLRNEAAEKVTQAIIENQGKVSSKAELKELGIEEIDTSLTAQDKDQLRLWKILFTGDDFLMKLYAYGMRTAQPPLSNLDTQAALGIAGSLNRNSPHAVSIAHILINNAWRDLKAGVPIDLTAEKELNCYLIPIFEHPDALTGLTALAERKFPVFSRA